MRMCGLSCSSVLLLFGLPAVRSSCLRHNFTFVILPRERNEPVVSWERGFNPVVAPRLKLNPFGWNEPQEDKMVSRDLVIKHRLSRTIILLIAIVMVCLSGKSLAWLIQSGPVPQITS